MSHLHDQPTAQMSLQNDLHKIYQFGKDWQITFNGSKTMQQTFTLRNTQHPPSLIFDKQHIPFVTSHKHLGLTISTDLHFHQHVNDTILKVNKALSPLYPLSRILPRHILNNIYTVYILPLFDYCDVIYNGHLTTSDSLRLDKIHNRAARLISGALFRTHTKTLLEDLGWLTLKARRDIHRLTTFHTLICNQHQLPINITSLLPSTRAHETNRSLRNSATLTLPPNRTTLYQNSFIPSTVRRWNQLPPEVTSLQTSRSFKREIHQRYGAVMPSLYNNFGSRLGNILHARLRSSLSHLNADMFQIQNKIADSPSCVCGFPYEDTKHFVLICPIYQDARTQMLQETSLVIPNFTQLNNNLQLDIYLNGNHIDINAQRHIAYIFQKFILNTKRFSS